MGVFLPTFYSLAVPKTYSVAYIHILLDHKNRCIFQE